MTVAISKQALAMHLPLGRAVANSLFGDFSLVGSWRSWNILTYPTHSLLIGTSVDLIILVILITPDLTTRKRKQTRESAGYRVQHVWEILNTQIPQFVSGKILKVYLPYINPLQITMNIHEDHKPKCPYSIHISIQFAVIAVQPSPKKSSNIERLVH